MPGPATGQNNPISTSTTQPLQSSKNRRTRDGTNDSIVEKSGRLETAHLPHITPVPRLTCESCRIRKIKCDKATPCSSCSRSGISCILTERHRLARGRNNTSSKVKATESKSDVRHSSLRTLNRSLRPDVENVTPGHSLGGSVPLGNIPSLPQHHLSPSISSTLQDSGSPQNSQSSSDILGHPAQLSDLSNENRVPLTQIDGPSLENSNEAFGGECQSLQLLGFSRPFGLSSVSTPTFQLPPNLERFLPLEVQQQLCRVYLEQVDPVFKVLHWPSLYACLMNGKQYLNYDSKSPAVEALAAAVYYAAASSLTEAQSLSIFGSSKAIAIHRCQVQCEMALNRTDLTITEDLTVLQAFVLFLISTRLHDRTRRVWTLLSLALRIAQALSIHLENSPLSLRPFEQEMGRRVWLAICLLDVQSALDQATEPMVPETWLTSNPPANINDTDLEFEFAGTLQDSGEFTDMSFTLMICTAQFAIRYLNLNPRDCPEVSQWDVRQQRVDTFKEKSAMILRNSTPDSNHFHLYTMKVAEYLSAAMQLVALRPLRYLPKTGAPPVEPGSLLKLSVDILQKSQDLLNDPRVHLWYWFDGIFIEWHALAVAISEICALREKHLIQTYWPLVEVALSNFNNLVANSKLLKLWRPIEELIARTRHTLNQHLFKGNSLQNNSATMNEALSLPIAEVNFAEWFSPDLVIDSAAYQAEGDSAFLGVELADQPQGEFDPISDNAWALWEALMSDNSNNWAIFE